MTLNTISSNNQNVDITSTTNLRRLTIDYTPQGQVSIQVHTQETVTIDGKEFHQPLVGVSGSAPTEDEAVTALVGMFSLSPDSEVRSEWVETKVRQVLADIGALARNYYTLRKNTPNP